jgi:lipoprotein-releasing system ATP-binding protein
MANIISLKNIDKIYGSVVKSQVLNNINLSFKEGSFNSIIGSSGSGKSTLLNIMGTLDKPTSGEVFISGKRTDIMKKNELAELAGQQGTVFLNCRKAYPNTRYNSFWVIKGNGKQLRSI